jgi:hypothetical protein
MQSLLVEVADRVEDDSVRENLAVLLRPEVVAPQLVVRILGQLEGLVALVVAHPHGSECRRVVPR